jgi:hypothetical protein
MLFLLIIANFFLLGLGISLSVNAPTDIEWIYSCMHYFIITVNAFMIGFNIRKLND